MDFLAALLADGVYVGWGALLVILVIVILYFAFVRGRGR